MLYVAKIPKNVESRSENKPNPAYTLKAPDNAGAFYFFNDFPIRLKRHPIPGTIDLHIVN